MCVAFLNKWTAGTPLGVAFTLGQLGLDHPGGYRAVEVFSGQEVGWWLSVDIMSAKMI